MILGRLILTTWNTDSLSARGLLSNLFSEVRLLDERAPVFVDAVEGGILPSHPLAKDSTDPLASHISQASVADAPICSIREFPRLLKELSRRNKEVLLEDRNILITADDSRAQILGLQVKSILALVDPDSSPSSFLYKFLKASKPKDQDFMKLHIVIVGRSRIESAAEAFVEIRDDLVKHYTASFDIVFAGFLSPDQEKLKLANSHQKLMPSAFPGDSFHGQIKHIWRQLESGTAILEKGRLLPILRALHCS